MIDRNQQTLIHKRVELAERGENPTVIARMRSGFLVLADNQAIRGWCILLPSPVVFDLNSLDDKARQLFLTDMARAGDAIQKVTGAYRMNYSILGNTDQALHAHLHPRYESEPPDQRKLPIWNFLKSLDEDSFELNRHGALMDAIRCELSQNSD